MDSGWTLVGWSRKVDGMVTQGGWDGHGSWTGWSRKVDGKRSKSKDLPYKPASIGNAFATVRKLWLVKKTSSIDRGIIGCIRHQNAIICLLCYFVT